MRNQHQGQVAANTKHQIYDRSPGLAVEIAGLQPETLNLTTEWVQHAEKLGCSMAFAAEAWWSDAATPLAYLADKTEKIKLATGIMQVTARTPAMTAMTRPAKG